MTENSIDIDTPETAPRKRPDDAIDHGDLEDDVIHKPSNNYELDRTVRGHEHFNRLGWKRLTIMLIVQSIALGSLSLPSAFATLGMVAGIIVCLGLGCVAIYASYMVGLAKLKYPHVDHYVGFGRLLLGGIGDKLFMVGFVALMTLTVGSHCLTGKLAFSTIANTTAVCGIIFGVVSAVLLFAFAIPPSFAEMSILGFIDFASIIAAIGITIIATGIQRDNSSAPAWNVWPQDDLSFSEAFVAISNIAFAYSFASAQPSFMDEMHTPQDFKKSICTLGAVQMVIYVLTGSLIFAFVGPDVKSPALLSTQPLISRIAFGVALPVTFISGSINATVASRYIHGRIYKDSIVRYVNTVKGWVTWLAVVAAITIVAWIISELVPFFSELLSICSSLLTSGFSFYIPALLWFFLLKEGSWFETRNIVHAILNLFTLAIGLCMLGCGLYASIRQVVSSTLLPFPCQGATTLTLEDHQIRHRIRWTTILVCY